MNEQKYKLRVIVAACSFALASMSGIASAQSSASQNASSGSQAATGNSQTMKDNQQRTSGSSQAASKQDSSGSQSVAGQGMSNKQQTATGSDTTAKSGASKEDAKDAAKQVSEATKVVKQMERDGKLKQVVQQAQGIFIIPDYGRAAAGVGVRGGEGVVLVKQGGKWSDPAFYNMGGISAGLQAGAEGGSIVMILNSQKAVDSFKQDNNWSLNADAGLTVVNWSAKAQASAGKGDVIVWSNAKGLLADAALSVSDINFDEDETAAFYGKQATLQDIFNGKVKAPQQVAALKQALPAGSGSTTRGSSGSKSDGAGSSSSGASGSGTSGSSVSGNSTPAYTKPTPHAGAGTTGTGIGGTTGAGSSSSGGSGSNK